MEHDAAVKKKKNGEESYDKIWQDAQDTVLSEKARCRMMYMKCHFGENKIYICSCLYLHKETQKDKSENNKNGEGKG